MAQILFANNTLTTKVTGEFQDGIPLANITIAGADTLPTGIKLHVDGAACDSSVVEVKAGGGVTYITGLEGVTEAGAWVGDLRLEFEY